jgi:transposase
MLAPACTTTNPFAFPVAAVPLSPQARLALLPGRLMPAWLTARRIDLALDRLDLGCLAPLYRRRGSLPFSPRLMLALALFCIADGLPSPADWASMANRDGPTRWLIWGIEPSSSACYSFRDRLGEDALLELNRQVLALAVQDGLSPANRAAIDGTLQQANASRHHLVNQQRIEQGLLALAEPAAPAGGVEPQPGPPRFAPDPAAAEPTQQQPPQDPAASEPAAKQTRRPVRPGRSAAGRARQKQRWHQAQQQLQERQHRNGQKRASKRTDPAKMVISPTDAQAAVGRDKLGVFRPLYNAQLVADVDSDLILGYQVLAQQNDSGVLGAMLDRTKRLLGHGLEQALVDGAYVGGADLAEAEARGVQILGPLAAEPKGKQLPKSAFRYQAQDNRYVCPQGKELEQVGQSRQKRSSVELVTLTQYQNRQGDCQGCPRKPECCPKSKEGRTISRSEHEGSIERLRERMSQAGNKKKYKRRAASVERLFGDGKQQRGMDRVCGRGLRVARIQLSLMVLQHNLRVLGKATQGRDKPSIDAGSHELAA